MQHASPFLIGIDLGTTNSACAFVDARSGPRPQRDRGTERGGVEIFSVPQLVEPFVVEARPILPSFLYFGEPGELDAGALALPWDPRPDAVVGVLARERGAVAPARQVASAKSWLAHPGVDRRAAILPWGAEGPRISPVGASARYLAYLRDAWNATTAAGDESLRFERQAIVLTVPASFDQEARELTVEAAHAAGLTRLTLLEEPVAAFYAWAVEHAAEAAAILADEHIALICDVGGGTTDFSLIRVRIEAGAPSFERIAIGDHLLLGGDNLDVALAAGLERRIASEQPAARLAITQRSALRRLCSAAKERLLGIDPPDRLPITLLGAGRAVVGESIRTELTRQDVERALAEFLPVGPPNQSGPPRDRRAGFRELALPYESDPAITRHLAAFLARSAAALPDSHPALAGDGALRLVRPDLVLFNGGFFAPPIARDRVMDALGRWFDRPPRPLATASPETAVALGAATYARLRAGIGPALPLVRAGSARTYYVGLRTGAAIGGSQALSVLSRGAEEGTLARIDQAFTVAANRPVSFSLYSSALRADPPGALVPLAPGDDLHEHAPLVTVLRYGRKSRQIDVPVRLSAAFTEVGTLELWCESQISDHRWRLQFQLRAGEAGGAGAPEREDAGGPAEMPPAAATIIADEAVASGEHAVRALFTGAAPDVAPDNVVARLEQQFGYAKTSWPLGTIRRLADALLEVAEGRRRSPAHEARWLNLFGFCVRPGFGAAKDPWRISEARKIYLAGLVFDNAIQNRVEWLVLWQRAAGGFGAGQQRELAQRVMGDLGVAGRKASRLNPQIERESWRLLASLERLDAGLRVAIGDALLLRLRRDPDNPSLLWALGRLGARAPLYGPLTSVVPPEAAALWLDALVGFKTMTPDLAAAIVQIGARTADPFRDLDEQRLARARERLLASGAGEDAARALLEPQIRTAADASTVFGEPLPDGLRLEG